MKQKKLRIGRIPYANLYPLFYFLERKCDDSRYIFVNGVPSRLNRKLREGRIDVSPSSSIEYLRNKDQYLLLPWSSISSSGPIQSILLFSRYPLNELKDKSIAVTTESETSSVLLKIIMQEFLSIRCTYYPVARRSVTRSLSSFPAVLFIGDTAMKEAKKIQAGKIQDSRFKIQSSGSGGLYIYDLGEIWDSYIGLPFVFALWVVNRKAAREKEEFIRALSEDLVNAKRFALRKFPLIARDAPHSKWMGAQDLVRYWKIISYDFTERHMEGLRLFETYAVKHKLG